MSIFTPYVDRNKMHHIYLIPGDVKAVKKALMAYLFEDNGMHLGGASVLNYQYPTFGIADARGLRQVQQQRNHTREKVIYLLEINSITLEAQNALLKTFEEPNEGTFFFILVPRLNMILLTVQSRAFVLELPQFSLEASAMREPNENSVFWPEHFLALSPTDRLAQIEQTLAIKKKNAANGDTGFHREDARLFLGRLLAHLRDRDYQHSDPETMQKLSQLEHYLGINGVPVKMVLERVALLL